MFKKTKGRKGFTPHLLRELESCTKLTIKKGVGFTLVELLVVVSIIGILSTLSNVSVNIARVRARDAKRKADIAQVKLALYFYYDDNLQFPDADELPEKAIPNWNNILIPALNGNPPEYVYMVLVPKDPLNKAPHFYGYNTLRNDQEFVLSYYLEDGGPQEFHGY